MKQVIRKTAIKFGKATRAKVAKEVVDDFDELLSKFIEGRKNDTKGCRLDYIDSVIPVGGDVAVLVRVGAKEVLENGD